MAKKKSGDYPVPRFAAPSEPTVDDSLLASMAGLVTEQVTIKQVKTAAGLGVSGLALSPSHGGTLPHGLYRYAVSAVDGAGHQSLVSATETVNAGAVDLDPPQVFIGIIDGTHQPGRYFFQVTALQNGQESAPSVESGVTVSSQRLNPPVLADPIPGPGGNLGGTYYYSVTAANVRGQVASNEVTVSVSGNSVIELDWVGDNRADGYFIYRGTESGVYERLDVALPVGTNVFIDDGSSSLVAPDDFPLSNQTERTVGFRVSWSAVPGATSYRVYRSETSGAYANSLISEVADEFYEDVDAVAGAGMPPQEDWRVALSWSVAAGADSYVVYRETPDGLRRLSSTAQHSFVDDGSGQPTDESPPEVDATRVRGDWPSGAVLSAGSTKAKYALATSEDAPVCILGHGVDVSDKAEDSLVVISGAVKASQISLADKEAPLSVAELRAVAAGLGGRLDLVHQILFF